MSDNDSVKPEHAKKADSSDPIISHPVETDPDTVLKHWTKERMRKAKPAPMPKVDKIDHGKKQRRRAPHSSDPKHS